MQAMDEEIMTDKEILKDMDNLTGTESSVSVEPLAGTEKKNVLWFEIAVISILSVTMLAMIWAMLLSNMHERNQAMRLGSAEAAAEESNAKWNEATLRLNHDMEVWNQLNELRLDMEYAELTEDQAAYEKSEWKFKQIKKTEVSEEFAVAVDWALAQSQAVSPFDMEGYEDSYFAEADSGYDQAKKDILQAERDGKHSDKFALASVICAVVLFLAAVTVVTRQPAVKMGICILSAVVLLMAVVYMFTIPLPTDFSFQGLFM